ncbi:MAG: hypothetical protein ACTHK8_18940 [Ginsengibacter sp.]
MNHQQNKTLYALLNATGLLEQKANIVLSFTEGKSESSKDLTDAQANDMIAYLRRQQQAQEEPANKMRRRILSMAHEMHWYLPGARKLDMEHINDWCKKFGYLHKELNQYSYKELPKLVTQFSAVYNDYLNKI